MHIQENATLLITSETWMLDFGGQQSLLPVLVLRVNICMHVGSKLQLSFTYVTGIFHKLKTMHSIC